MPTTLLRPLHGPIFHHIFSRRREQLLCQLARLDETITTAGPKYVLFHLLAPHPPYVFKADGTAPEQLDLSPTNWLPRSAYVEQLEFVNREISSAIDRIQSISRPSPIIIVQGDHGPASTAAVTRLRPPP